MAKESGASSETAKLIRDRYSPIPRDQNEKVMDAIQKLLSDARDPSLPLKAFLNETGRLIHRLFDFKEIAIGIRSKKDDLFRYEVLIGFSSDAESARKKLTYTQDEMINSNKYPNGIMITKKTEFMIVELQSYITGEEITFNRPNQLMKERSSIEDIIDGDYIEVYFFGRKNEVIGYIELSGTRSGKMPSRSTMRWLELMSSIIASVICERDPSKI